MKTPEPGRRIQKLHPLKKTWSKKINLLQQKKYSEITDRCYRGSRNITFPTDLKLLNAARKNSGLLTGILYHPTLHGKIKICPWRKAARKYILDSAKKKRLTAKEIYKAKGRQPRFLKRNLALIDFLLSAHQNLSLTTQRPKVFDGASHPL